jgi:predicted lipoprotein with Yx(FWY)xxD motif
MAADDSGLAADERRVPPRPGGAAAGDGKVRAPDGVHERVTPTLEPKEPCPMRPTSPRAHARPRLLGAAALAAAVAFAVLFMLLAPPRGEARGGGTLRVSTARNAALGKRILVTSSGLTLYSLSAETRGRFICTGTCTADWPPLTLGRGVQPTGVRGLGTIRRPDGRRQVTYKGRPLYRFDEDHKRGDVHGEGFRDVGTWHAAAAPASSGSSGGSGGSSGGGYGY